MKTENKNKKVVLKTKTFAATTKKKAIAKQVYEEVMAKYPNLMEMLKNS